MQRQFDIENEKDMQDLWDILPDKIIRIRDTSEVFNKGCCSYDKKEEKDYFITTMLRINWHDKTEITRPIQEATEQDVGKLCYFWDNDGTRTYGLLSDLIIEGSEDRKYGCCYGRRWTHARRLTKQEIEELC